MKTKTTYEELTPLEVAQIGECTGWPVEGLVVSDDRENWQAENIYFVKLGSKWPFKKAYCARPVEKIEWEVGDLVWVTVLDRPAIVNAVNKLVTVNMFDTKANVLAMPIDLKPWTPGYRYTLDGEPVVTAEHIEYVLRTLPDYREQTVSDVNWKGSSWVFHYTDVRRAKQTAEFADALNEQIRKAAQ